MWISLWLLSYIMIIAFIAMHYAANILFRKQVVEDKVLEREEKRITKVKTASMVGDVDPNLPIEKRRTQMPSETSEPIRDEASLEHLPKLASNIEIAQRRSSKGLIEMEDRPKTPEMRTRKASNLEMQQRRSSKQLDVEEMRPRKASNLESQQRRSSKQFEDMPVINLKEPTPNQSNEQLEQIEVPRIEIEDARSRKNSKMPQKAQIEIKSRRQSQIDLDDVPRSRSPSNLNVDGPRGRTKSRNALETEYDRQ
eukprot:NODE_293_length_10559_cov_1.046463.p5 type:complete len:253 gc:universal NODE_293_length_10559_cov_1.046463:6638-5880(-)